MENKHTQQVDFSNPNADKITSNTTISIKQETLEEAAENYVRNESDTTLKLISKYSFKDGAKWQAERMYSEEDLLGAFEAGMMFIGEDKGSFKEWFEQFKKK